MRFGRAAGLNSQEMKDLAALEKDKFDYKEWAALMWVRDYITFEGEFPEEQVVEEFEKLYTIKEQKRVVAVFKTMFFFNMLGNTINQKGSRLRPEDETLTP